MKNFIALLLVAALIVISGCTDYNGSHSDHGYRNSQHSGGDHSHH